MNDITTLIVICLLAFHMFGLALGRNVTKIGATEDSIIQHNKASCKRLRHQHKVKPGVSWGSMIEAQQSEWMGMRCDTFFCQPNALESRGSYHCIPLKIAGEMKTEQP